MSTNNPTDKLYDTETAATRLTGESDDPISPRTLEWWRMTGRGPKFVKVGNRVRYRDRDLEAWLTEQTRTHTRATA